MSVYETTYDPSTKTWSGRPLAPIYHPNVNAGQVLLDVLWRNPQKIGQINDNNGRRLSNQEIAVNTVRVAQHLAELGIRSGDVITVMASNHHHLASVVFAGIVLAAPIHILGINFATDEITRMLRLTSPKIMFCEPSNVDRVLQALKETQMSIPIFTFYKHENANLVDDLLLETGSEKDFVPTLLTDGHKHAAVILCSSGTTGPAKAIPISHATMLYQFNQQLLLDMDDVYFIPCSLVWVASLKALISSTLRGATRIITEHDVSAEQTLQIFEKYRVTSTFVSLYALSLMLQSPLMETVDLSSMRRLGCGGSVLSDLHRARMNQYLSNGCVINIYGLSDIAAYLAIGLALEPAGSVGLLGSGHQIRVVDEHDECCGPDEEGEILVKVAVPVMGYWNDARSTEQLLTQDGYARTGDVGRFDADGFLYLTDRLKEMLKYRGRNVSPSLVENAVLNIKGVTAVCVVGVFDDDVEELPTAVVVSDGHHEVTERMVQELVEETIAEKDFLCGGVYFVDKLPKTHSGKVQRRGVKSIATELYKKRIAQRG